LDDLKGTETLIIPETDIDTAGSIFINTSGVAQNYYVHSTDNVADVGGGTGARTVVINGIDASFNKISETIGLTGTTPVITTLQYLNINNFLVTVVGSGGSNAGTILVTGNNVAPFQYQLSACTGSNFSSQSHFQTPINTELYITSVVLGTSVAGAQEQILCRVKRVPPSSQITYVIAQGTIAAGGEFTFNNEGTQKLIAGEIAYFTAQRVVSAATLKAFVIIQGYLRDIS